MFYKTQAVIVFILLLNNVGTPMVAQSTSGDPVNYTVEAPETVKAGDEFVISTVFNIAPNWYVYAPIAMNTAQGKIPTKVSFKVPAGIKKMGTLQLPDQNVFFDTYRGQNIRMSQKFQVVKDLEAGKQTIVANIIYQTCNDETCYPPVRKKIDIAITVE
ncbi:protein-disulfide reductase DsbD family protein [Flavivirga aquimarina]|uniref:Protein-disulfide reductase DsbD family protein n=1 Tax=Flavivirga aquimarina TaxID=2027862 RepID=A0ABT8WDX9_9FLAO|nr:protein-disulfide reductase DsbD domain-containing protein [Flavivirga aquimarina]MDO5971216.1 protein-disulfide reductase DsbD family protein [Flavivirga aquimarina]